ncbi:MAG: class I SAM-dependent methyltransferase [Candidatus Andersenbacteria bacterium]|nr:class I SAM-dependent methyltransferase [Candidatus Andersenbacteria bacterium]
MADCRVCQAPLSPFISFGQMPIANGFLTPAEYADEYFFELAVCFCEQCQMVQLLEQPDRQRMFHDHYAFYSSTSAQMAEHFRDYAHFVQRTFLTGDDPLVVELGSNDGIMLQHFAKAGVRHLGVEPSRNVARVAQARGVETVSEFFDRELAERILAEHGPADAILAANTMCHIADIRAVAAGVARLLKEHGVLIFEEPYLGEVIEKASYDQFYDEHVFMFSVSSIQRLFAGCGLEVIDVWPQNVHGGSMRYILARRGVLAGSARVPQLLEYEREQGLDRLDTYNHWRARVERSRVALHELLVDRHRRGKRVVGYGATSKSTTVINYCGITPELLEFISDTTPIKQGKYSPGAHIPVRAYENFTVNYPDYALLFAWNHAGEIMAKERAFERAGGQWISFVPRVEVLARDLVQQS